LAYVAGRRGLRRVDVSDPLAPVAIRGLFSTAAPAYAVTATGELAYVAAYEAGLYVVRSDTGWEALLPLTSCH
jgi:hypothetical protein